MLLQEITDPKHEDLSFGELRVLIDTFPRTWEKMLERLRGKPGRLKFRGLDIYDERGYGPAVRGVIRALKEDVKDGHLQLEVHVAVGVGYNEMMNVHEEVNIVRVFYRPSEDKLYLGIDAWVDGEEFNRHFDEVFERATGEEFDYDQDDHREIFDHAAQEFNKVGIYGMLISCDYDGMKPMWELELEAAKGFHRGIDPLIQNMDLIPL